MTAPPDPCGGTDAGGPFEDGLAFAFGATVGLGVVALANYALKERVRRQADREKECCR